MHTGRDSAIAWQRLRSEVSRQEPLLSAPPPLLLARGTGMCALCRGPARPGGPHCYHCGQFTEYLPGLLPDAVVPVAYAPKGSPHATSLWRYKSARPQAAAAAAGTLAPQAVRAAREALLALLLVFLRDHGTCVWRQAGMARPTHAAVVPSRRARPGIHPLQVLAARYLRLPWISMRLACSEDPDSCDPDPERFSAPWTPGASVLLLDDTWTSGASATSAAAALKLAGAGPVAVVVAGRHLDAQAAETRRFAPSAMPFRPALCSVHAACCQ